jgi:hypothetical protein
VGRRTRALIVGVALSCCSHFTPALWGQWKIGPNGNLSYTGGNVDLEVDGGADYGPILNLKNSAGYGIGSFDFYTYPGQTIPSARWQAADLGGFTADHIFYTSIGVFPNAPLAARMTIKGLSGNVGIGTTNPQYSLSVNGTVQAKEVIVNTGWADYVFYPVYRLKPLTELAAYIRKNRHLPDIPSETEVKQRGVSLGDMQAKLLAKIEQLTLYMIQTDERSNRLEQQNREMKHENLRLQERIKRLEMRNTNSSRIPAR